jgi:ribosomal protein S18 acetylase RimI-like enzyme
MRGTRDMSFTLRPAIPDDHAALARLFPELGVSDPLPTPEQFASRMVPRTVILGDGNHGGEPVGYAFWQIYGLTAHVVQVVVDPRVRGRGAGRVLMDEVRRRVVVEGSTRWYLNVKQDNAVALRLYERCGLAIEQEGWAVSVRWAELAPASEGPHDAVLFTPTGADDPAIAALGVDMERVALLRARSGVVLFTLRERGEVVAFGAFDPAFPGVYPIRVARAELAGALFDGFRAHAKGDDVNVFVEGDRALFERLHAAGARVKHSLYRMGGTLSGVGTLVS